MAQVNPLTRELLVKLVYYGPGLGGKTTCLQHLHSIAPAETRGQLVSLATPVDRTLYFDFLPLRGPQVRGHHVRLQLFTVPGQVYFNATRKLVLTGADGVVFVADSQRERLDANLESLENLAANFHEQGRDLADVPLVLLYNKQDLPRVLMPDELDVRLNPSGRPRFGSVATRGDGVVAGLDRLVELVIEDLEARGTFGGPESLRAPSRSESFGAPSGAESSLGAPSSGAPSRPDPGAEIATSPRLEALGPGRAFDAQLGEAAFRAHLESAVVPEPSTLPSSLPSSLPSGFASEPPTTRRGVGLSFAPLFRPEHALRVRTLEGHLATGAIAEALGECEVLIDELLARAAQRAGVTTPEPAMLAAWLGVPAPRWLAFRSALRRAQGGAPISERDGLAAHALLVDLALALAD
ncbi:MAG: gliding motility protein [Myxococcales bacterium]|nr:gliding motility protein [Myxococcales bacterium]